MFNNKVKPSSEVQVNFGVLQIDAENSATGVLIHKSLFLLLESIRLPYILFFNNNTMKVGTILIYETAYPL